MAAIISLAGLDSNVQRHLSTIGKRLYDKDGKNLFSNITVSSAETSIFTDYMDAAAQNIAGALAQFVTAYSSSSITFHSDRWGDQLPTALTQAVQSYAVFFTVGEYLAMTHPELAEKYYRDAQNMMNTVVSIAFQKQAPQATADVTAPTAVVTTT